MHHQVSFGLYEITDVVQWKPPIQVYRENRWSMVQNIV